MNRKILLGLTSVLVLVSSMTAQTDVALRRKVFEKVWGTVNDKFYDPNFNGVDWKAAHDKYLSQALSTKKDEDFYAAVSEMLALLKVSHLQVGTPAEVEKRFKQPQGVTGLSLRQIEGRITVFRSLQGYPAEKAGIHSGFVVTGINDAIPDSLIDASRSLAGEPGKSVTVRYLNAAGEEHEATLVRQALSDKGKIEGLNIYALFVSRQLDNGIGYLWFSSFVPFLNDRISATFEQFKDAPAIILDLRGNSGGDDSVAFKIDDKLFESETQLMLIKTRKGVLKDVRAHGNKSAYKGKVVILVDEFSGSASEDLAAGLQESGRAFVIGHKTMGQDLDADIVGLPDGGMLVYPFGYPTTVKGVPVEGRGVIPDLIVDLKRNDLLTGRDTQLEAALSYIQTSKN